MVPVQNIAPRLGVECSKVSVLRARLNTPAPLAVEMPGIAFCRVWYVLSLDLMKRSKSIEKIIEDAGVDTYSDDEALGAWDAVLTDNIKMPQRCKVGGQDATLIGIESGNRALYGVVKLECARRIRVPIEDVCLEDRAQNAYVEAYEEGFC